MSHIHVRQYIMQMCLQKTIYVQNLSFLVTHFSKLCDLFFQIFALIENHFLTLFAQNVLCE